MQDLFSPEQRRDFLRRGFTRRDFGRIAALMTAGAALPFYNEAALAQGLSAGVRIPADAVKINANENPMGPCPEAIEAIQKLVPEGGRYLYQETFAFIDAMAATEDVPRDHVLPFAGSSDPLHRVVLALLRPRAELRRRRPRLRGRREGRRVRRSQDDQGPAPQGLVARRPRDGRGRPERRRHLRLQPQQSDRLDHPEGRDSSIWSPTSPRGRSSCWTRRTSTSRRRPSLARRWSPPART